MTILSESELLYGCHAQDRKVQGQLYKQYYSLFLKVCMRYAPCQMDAEQWMNDGFYKIFTRIEQYKREGSFEGWMKQIMVRTCLDNLRSAIQKQGRRLVDMDETKAEQISQPGLDAIQQLSFKELATTIQALPPMHKAVFNLYVFDGFSHKEIAQQFNIKEGTSYWYLNQAREMLKQKMVGQVAKTVRYDR